MNIAIYICFGLLIVLNIVKIILEKREVKTMTIKEFERKVNYYCERKDGKRLVAFMGRNAFFVLTHQKQVAEILRAYGGDCNKNNTEV